MKVRTVGVLAALGMTLTSLTVWSVTPPGSKTAVAEERTWGSDSEALDTGAVQSAAVFTSGTTLAVEGRLGHAKLLADRDNETLLFVDVKADSNAESTASAPLNLAIVVDRSGSMKGKRLANALDAARGMIRRLRDGDVVSLVAYNTSADIVLPPTTVDSFSRGRAIDAVDAITAQGDTCISCGIETAMRELGRRTGMVDRILLLSDGEATAGVRDVDGFRRIAERCRGMGASISAIGVDVEYNERVMSVLALESNGRHHFVDDAGDLSRAFDDELATLVKSVAKDAELAVELAPGVELVEVVDRTFRREGDKLVVPLGAFSAGEEKTLLVKVRVPRGAEGTRPVAGIRLGFSDLSKGGGGSAWGKLATELVGSDQTPSELDPIVRTRSERAETASVLREANDLFNRGRADEAQRKLSARLATVRQGQAVALNAAPTSRSADLKKDFDDQTLALDEAEKGFASAPAAEATPATGAPAGGDFAPPPRPAPPSRKNKAQVKENAARADAFAF